MIRSGFKRIVRAREKSSPAPVPEHLRRKAVMARADGLSAPVRKEEPLRSEGYRRLVASLPCINCRKVGRSQHAHENHGKGARLKVDDRRSMPLCADEPGIEGCHSKFDQYRLLSGGREAHIVQGEIWSAQTREWIVSHGLWPAGLPMWPE